MQRSFFLLVILLCSLPVIGNVILPINSEFIVEPERSEYCRISPDTLTIDSPVQEFILQSKTGFPAQNGDAFDFSFRLHGKGRLTIALFVNEQMPVFAEVNAGNEEQEIRRRLVVPDIWKSVISSVRPGFVASPGASLTIRNFTVTCQAGIRHGDFEQSLVQKEGVTGWYFDKSGAFSLESGVGNAGSKCLRARLDGTQKTGKDGIAYAKQWVYLAPETIYTLKGRVKAENFQGYAGFLLTFRGGSKSDNKTISHMPVVASTDGWVNLSYTFVTPPTLKYCAMRLCTINGSGTVFFDDVHLHDGNAVHLVPYSPDGSEVLQLKGFFKVNKSRGWARESTPDLTRISLYADLEKLYIQGRCLEPEMPQLRSATHPRDHSDIYKDDNVEIFIDPQGMQRNYHQIIINPAGAVMDFIGRNSTWDGCQAIAERMPDQWSFRIEIPFTELGYGSVEAAQSGKSMGVAFFRNRRTTGEVYSCPYWSKPGYQHMEDYIPIRVGNKIAGCLVDFHYQGTELAANQVLAPMAWQLHDPLYQELMTSERLYKPEDRAIGYFGMGWLEFGNDSSRPATLFALQHGMKYQYADIAALKHETRTVNSMTTYNFTGADISGKSFAAKMHRKYDIPLMLDYKLRHCDGLFGVKTDLPRVKKAGLFSPDPRVADLNIQQLSAYLQEYKGQLAIIRLGHEDDQIPFRYYEEYRKLYLEKDPEQWKSWEASAKEEFGQGRIGFPSVPLGKASPPERLVWGRWVQKNQSLNIRRIVQHIRMAAPWIKLSSGVGGGGIAHPFGYDRQEGCYDHVTNQTRAGGGVNRQETAFLTKVLNDLSGVPATPCVHIESYFTSLTPEATNEVLSSVFRVGGSGYQLALFDWFGNSQCDLYGAPERFHEVIHIFREYGRMNKLKFPEADCAVLYSNINQLAEHYFSTNPDLSGNEELFTMLGPIARSWFDFVSDYQILDGKRELNRYKALYIPRVIYQDQPVVDKILAYVRQGGTLVFCEKDAFRYDTDGSEREALVTLGTTGEALIPGVDVCNLGKGRILTLNGSPLNEQIFTDAARHSFFITLQQKLGCRTGLDIWRFRFPPAPKYQAWPEGKVCLTGNAWRWQRNIPLSGPNQENQFSCSYSFPPDLFPDIQNNLFNRRDSLSAPITDGSHLRQLFPSEVPEMGKWCVAWKNTEAVTVFLDFSKEVKADEAKIWLHGDYTSVEIWAEGKCLHGIRRAQPPEGENEVDVDEICMNFPETRAKRFEIRFGRRAGTLYVSEIELWGVE